MNKEPLRYFEFGPFRLSLTDRLLMKSDRIVPLTPKLVDTLIVLVENSERVLTKNALMETLWPDSFVEESSLTQNISLLRKALGESGDSQQFIETIPKRGYRFVADVREVNAANGADAELVVHERTSTQLVIEEQLVTDIEGLPGDALPHAKPALATQTLSSHRASSRRLLAVITALAVWIATAIGYLTYRGRWANAAATPKSIAVLPFKTIGTQAENELMGLGMADALIIKLSRLEGTTVLPTGSVHKYTHRDEDVLAIAKDLGVEAVLDGTVQRDGDHVRVTAQLIRTSDGKTIWSAKLDDSYTDLFALEDSISEKMTAEVGYQVWRSSSNTHATGSTNAGAQLSYLTGLYFWNRRTKDNLSKAITYFETAVQKDPNFAVAHALLADSYYLASQDSYHLLSREDSLRQANASVTRALELDDTIAEAHTVKAAVLWNEMKIDEADQEFRRALALNPNYAVGHLRYGYFLFGAQKLDQALNEMRQAQRLDPVSPVANTALGFMLAMAHDFDGSITFNKKALELQPEVVAARFNLGLLYMQKQMFPEALAEFEQVIPIDPFTGTVGKIRTYGRSGRTEEARRMLKDLLSKQKESLTLYDAAVIYGDIGDKDVAFKYLDKIPVDRWNAARLKFDPEMDPLRGDPRYAEYLNRQTANASELKANLAQSTRR